MYRQRRRIATTNSADQLIKDAIPTNGAIIQIDRERAQLIPSAIRLEAIPTAEI